MHDAARVRDDQGLGDIRDERKRLARVHRSPVQPARQRLPFHILHDDAGASLGVDVDVVDRADTGMVERRGRPGLADETPLGARVGEPLG